MPLFHYEAFDDFGRAVHGSLHAPSEADVMKLLRKRGLQSVRLGGAAPDQPVALQAVQSKPQPQQVRTVAQPDPSAPTAVAPVGPPKLTHPLSHRQMVLQFEQLAKFVRSGIGVSLATKHMADQDAPSRAKLAWLDIQSRTAAGSSLADAMQANGHIFPSDAIAMVRCGELAGELPNALEEIARTAEAARRAARLFIWAVVMLGFIALWVPIGRGIQLASLSTIKRQDEAGGTLPAIGTLVQELSKVALPSLAASATSFAIAFLLHRLWLHPRLWRVRQGAASLLPPERARAHAEGLRRFHQGLTYLSKAGIAPATAVNLAVEAMPNLNQRERTRRSLGMLREGESYAQIMARIPGIPSQYAHILENGEMAGNLSGAFDSVVRDVSEREAQQAITVSASAKFVSMAVVAIVVLVLVGSGYVMFYNGIMKIFAKDI